MESANLCHQLQLQEQFVGCSSSAAQSSYEFSTTQDWNPSIILNDRCYGKYVNETLPNSRESWPKSAIMVPPTNSSMIQDPRFRDARSFAHQSANEVDFEKIKEDMSDSFARFSETYSLSSVEDFHLPSTGLIKDGQQYFCHLVHDNLKLNSLFSGHQITGLLGSAEDLRSNSQNSACSEDVATSIRLNFCHVFPSTNISNHEFSSSLASSSSGLNLQVSDLLSPLYCNGSCSLPSQDNPGFFNESIPLFHDQICESSNSPSYSSNKTSGFNNVVARTRPSLSKPKAFHAAPKKPRLRSQSSCPPLKVRKDKLRDRIAALQREVAPFGKTDTASVLTEAIGYIQFLLDQIQTLSVPYLNFSSSNSNKTMQLGSSREDQNAEPKQNLSKRGLCLVPMSFTSYIFNDNGGT